MRGTLCETGRGTPVRSGARAGDLELVYRTRRLVFVVRHHLGDERGERFEPLLARGMGAEPVGLTSCAGGVEHFFPELRRRVGIVAGLGGELDADAVGLRLLGSAVGKLYTDRSRDGGGLQCCLAL